MFDLTIVPTIRGNIFREIEAIVVLALGSTFTGLIYKEAADYFIGLGFVQLNFALFLYLMEFNQTFREIVSKTNFGVNYRVLFTPNAEEKTKQVDDPHA